MPARRPDPRSPDVKPVILEIITDYI